MSTTCRVYRQDHTGAGVLVTELDTAEQALEVARTGKAAATPGPLTANVWYVAAPHPDGSGKWDITYV